MNEDQEYNDHCLHIEACECGNLHPKLMGDDFDADINCDQCGRYVDGYGTKGAISKWNNRNGIEMQMIEKNENNSVTENSTVKELIAALFKAADKLDAQSKTEYWLRERAGELRNAAWEIKEFIAAQDGY